MEKLLLSRRRFQVLALPTGIGKSLIAFTYSIFAGKRVAILTSSKGLQDQYQRDYGNSGLVDARGMGNYVCLADKAVSCAEGACLDGENCWLRDGGCLYFDQLKLAKAAGLVVTNYAFWMTQKRTGRDSLGEFDLLVMDEAHDAPAEVTGFMKVELSPMRVPRSDLQLPEDGPDFTIDEWRTWATAEAARLEQVMARYTKGPTHRAYRQAKEEVTRLARSSGEWIPEKVAGGWVFEPVWPDRFAENWLWDGIPQVVLMSATIRPKSLEQMGLKPEDYDWIECPSPFAAGKRPIIHVPTVQMSSKTTESNLMLWVDRIDQVIEGRLDRKGIIHTVSYDRAKFLVEHSQYRDLMLTHTSKTARDTVARFKTMDPPAVLVSPSIHTGYDFAGETAEYQIIGKVPFPDCRYGIMRARAEADPDYAAHFAATQIVQAAGRIVRSPEDFGETFILDDNFHKWIRWKYKHFFPAWFWAAYKSLPSVPAPMKRPARPISAA